MFRTFAVLLLLLGLATATPVVCLCAPTVAAADAVGLTSSGERIVPDGAGVSERTGASATRTADAPSLVATSAAAVVASLVATASGLPTAPPWQPPLAVITRLEPLRQAIPTGTRWSPAVPPPR
jgi:hypothetical protein